MSGQLKKENRQSKKLNSTEKKKKKSNLQTVCCGELRWDIYLANL
jgi:hypothetical protein